MWQRQIQDDGRKTLSWKDLPASTDVRADFLITELTCYMRRLLERYESSDFIKYLVLPSPTALSGHFHCKADDIMHALKELERQGYEYEAAGHGGPITLWDPLIRRREEKRRQERRWPSWYRGIFNPIRQPLTS